MYRNSVSLILLAVSLLWVGYAGAQEIEPGVVPLQEVQISKTQAIQLLRQLPRLKNTAYLVVLTAPDWAKIRVNKKSYKEGSLLTIKRGQRPVVKIEVNAEGFKPITTYVRVRPQEVLKVFIKLKRIKGNLTVLTSPQGAKVFVDGRFSGTTPVTIRDIEPGTHEILMRSGSWNWKGRVLIKKGSTQMLSMDIPTVVQPPAKEQKVQLQRQPQQSKSTFTQKSITTHRPVVAKRPHKIKKPRKKPDCKKICQHYADVSGASDIIKQAFYKGCYKRCDAFDLPFTVCAWRAKNMDDVQKCASLPPSNQ